MMLLKAYYELLYERLKPQQDACCRRMRIRLTEQVQTHFADQIGQEQYAAYLEAGMAFFDERLEAYNPIGMQYLFDRQQRRTALELQQQLDWYDSRREFHNLLTLVRQKAQSPMTDQHMQAAAAQIIQQAGAFPDQSILEGYRDCPALEKLPDYILAMAIEDLLGRSPQGFNA
ncbi:MAG: hypothetical protein KBI46_05900 [Phycisphaerae bacterium]|nr:hypothetical protein [Phycisphaerae bacterium]